MYHMYITLLKLYKENLLATKNGKKHLSLSVIGTLASWVTSSERDPNTMAPQKNWVPWLRDLLLAILDLSISLFCLWTSKSCLIWALLLAGRFRTMNHRAIHRSSNTKLEKNKTTLELNKTGLRPVLGIVYSNQNLVFF